MEGKMNNHDYVKDEMQKAYFKIAEHKIQYDLITNYLDYMEEFVSKNKFEPGNNGSWHEYIRRKFVYTFKNINSDINDKILNKPSELERVIEEWNWNDD